MDPPLGPTQLEVTKYNSFMTGMMLLFGVSFEFPCCYTTPPR